MRPAGTEGGEDGEGDGEAPASGPPQTLAELVDELNALPRNSDLVISYQPAETGEGPEATTIDTTLSTDNVFTGYFSAQTAHITVEAQPRKVAYGEAVMVAGTVESSGDATVTIYRRYAGSATAVKVATTTAVAEGGVATFAAIVPEVRKNATLIARVAPSDGTLPGSASAGVKVSPRIWLSGGARLAVHVRPGDADGSALLQRRERRRLEGLQDGQDRRRRGLHEPAQGHAHAARQVLGQQPVHRGHVRAFTIRVP